MLALFAAADEAEVPIGRAAGARNNSCTDGGRVRERICAPHASSSVAKVLVRRWVLRQRAARVLPEAAVAANRRAPRRLQRLLDWRLAGGETVIE